MTKTVLLIEDEPNIVVAISFILQRAGWRVSSYGKGETALQEIARVRPDVMILDVMLPGRSGFDILADVRANKAGVPSDLPILMLTAKGQAKDRSRAQELGATAFMSKPFANQEILEQVASMMPEDAAQEAQ